MYLFIYVLIYLCICLFSYLCIYLFIYLFRIHDAHCLVINHAPRRCTGRRCRADPTPTTSAQGLPKDAHEDAESVTGVKALHFFILGDRDHLKGQFPKGSLHTTPAARHLIRWGRSQHPLREEQPTSKAPWRAMGSMVAVLSQEFDSKLHPLVS